MESLLVHQLPRDRSIVAWSLGGATAVVVSYVLALALAAACLALPWIAFRLFLTSRDSFLAAEILFAIFGVVAGITVLWSLVPRRQKFEPSGIRIDLDREKRLAAEIASVAAALNEPAPSEVYLLAEANAFVAQRGGMGGSGSRRILGIGLPLLEVLSVSEFRALLAHEFAHFYSGDTRLGPWVYKARLTMIQIYQNLGEKSDVLPFLTQHVVIAIPYMLLMGGIRAYWKLLMRITQAISRRQEFRSDEIACHIAGSEQFVAALRKVTKSEAIRQSYWQEVVLPVVARGFQPQLANSFGRYLTAPRPSTIASDFLERQLSETDSQPFDTHPPLGARIAKIQSQPTVRISSGPSEPNDSLPAVSLLDDLDVLESDLLRKLVPALKTVRLQPLDWDRDGDRIYVPSWRKEVALFLPVLSDKTVASLPELVRDQRGLADQIRNPPGILLSNSQRRERAIGVLAIALALALIDDGWTVHVQPAVFFLFQDALRLSPSDMLDQLKSGNLSAQEWSSLCLKAGIGHLTLGGNHKGMRRV